MGKNILAVDDEELARESLVSALKEVFAEDEIYAYGKASDAVEKTKELVASGKLDYAFLDIRLRGTTGIELAKNIKDLSPQTKIIFVTAYNDYASEAFAVSASGYLLKPVTADAVMHTVEKLEAVINGTHPVETASDAGDKQLKVTTFGKFHPTINGREMVFERSKSRELLALLIDQKGVGIANAEIEAYLWEDAIGDKRKSGYVQKVIASLMKTLRQAGLEDIVEKRYNYLAINPSKVDCDLYKFLAGDAVAINSYYGVYMEEYSWAEMTTGMLSSKAGLYD